MARQGLPARHDYAPTRRLPELMLAIFIAMALRERRHSADNLGGVVQAAEYVRMSTDHQQYSTENQHAAIQRFADAHGIIIVHSFIDAGKSGVGIQGRDALQELLRTVESGQADFSTILVYDVSRWGDSKNPTKERITSSGASGPTLPSSIALNNSPRTTPQ
jgi:Resolvase, N terminal domain